MADVPRLSSPQNRISLPSHSARSSLVSIPVNQGGSGIIRGSQSIRIQQPTLIMKWTRNFIHFSNLPLSFCWSGRVKFRERLRRPQVVDKPTFRCRSSLPKARSSQHYDVPPWATIHQMSNQLGPTFWMGKVANIMFPFLHNIGTRKSSRPYVGHERCIAPRKQGLFATYLVPTKWEGPHSVPTHPNEPWQRKHTPSVKFGGGSTRRPLEESPWHLC